MLFWAHDAMSRLHLKPMYQPCRSITPSPSTRTRSSTNTHPALERTFLGYLKTSQSFALLSVLISQLFKLQHRQNPDHVLGYNAVGKPLAIICMCMAIFYMLVGVFRWWRLQQGLVHGKAISAGIELALVAVGTALVCYFIHLLRCGRLLIQIQSWL